MDDAWLLKKLMVLGPLLLSLAVHEHAHARTALAFGDPTARNMGRVSLNPLRHLDPMGTIVLLLTQFIGWAKPVPVTPALLRPPRLGNAMVSLAGPMSNLFLALIARASMNLVEMLPLATDHYANTMLVLKVTTYANLGLFTFNLLPLFPLDGHHIARELISPWSQPAFMRWQINWGMKILLVLVFGPRLLQMVYGDSAINPLGWLYGQVTSNFEQLATAIGL